MATSSAPRTIRARPALFRQLAQRRRERSELFGKVGAAPSLLGHRMDLRGEIEVVDRAQQQPRLADDFARALAVAAVGGPEILAVDDLSEADDRVQRRLDLVDQLAQRIRVGEEFGCDAGWSGGGGRSRRAIPR